MDLTDRMSKTRFTKALQCPLRLYFTVHERELADEITPETQALFDKGNAVGALAQQCYPGGVLIQQDHLHQREAVAATAEAMGSGVPAVFEAAFTYDNVKVRVDVLRRLEDGGWELIEVKSTGSYKEEKHLPDAGIQLYVLRGAGVDVRRVSLMHLDTTYVYPGGEYDPQTLLTTTDVTEACETYLEVIPTYLARMMEVLASPERPQVPPYTSCTKPNTCEFFGYCHRDDPQHPITELCTRRSRLYRLLTDAGVVSIPQIPAQFFDDLSPAQTMHYRAVSGDRLVTDNAVLERLDQLSFPLHFVDFETLSEPLPIFVGTRPFQVVKVQWSVHTLHEDGRLEHDEFLADSATHDPGEEFLVALLDALAPSEPGKNRSGTLVHYSPYERTHLLDLAVGLPDLHERFIRTFPGWRGLLLDKLAQAGTDMRTVTLVRAEEDSGLATFDLGAEVVRTGCYHPQLHGGWTIKRAIEVLAPDLPPYSSLAVSDGQAAMRATAEMLSPETSAERGREIRAALLAYCEQDTLAMVHIYQTLDRLR